MLRPVMAQIIGAVAAEKDACVMEQARLCDLGARRPARGTIGGDIAVLPSAPERTADGGRAAEEAARSGERPGLVEHFGRIGLEMIPPAEQVPGPVNRNVEDDDPGQAKLRLIAQHGGGPLGCRPHTKNNDGENDEYLPDEQFGGGHDAGSDSRAATGGANEAKARSCQCSGVIPPVVPRCPQSSPFSANGERFYGRKDSSRALSGKSVFAS